MAPDHLRRYTDDIYDLVSRQLNQVKQRSSLDGQDLKKNAECACDDVPVRHPRPDKKHRTRPVQIKASVSETTVVKKRIIEEHHHGHTDKADVPSVKKAVQIMFLINCVASCTFALTAVHKILSLYSDTTESFKMYELRMIHEMNWQDAS